MSFQRKMQRRQLNKLVGKSIKIRAILSKEEEIAKFIAKKIMSVIKAKSIIFLRNYDINVKIYKVEDSCLKIKLRIFYEPDNNHYTEFFYIKTDRKELNYDSRSNTCFLTKILELLEVILKEEGFSNLECNKYRGKLHATLNLI